MKKRYNVARCLFCLLENNILNNKEKRKIIMKNKIKAMSLFANVGIAEAYLEEIGVDVVIANEIDPNRVRFYNYLYKKTEVICGDITEEEIRNTLISRGKIENVELVIATPPCQGMSTAGKQIALDPRNSLICHAVDIVNEIEPKYVLLENVPEQLTTKLLIENQEILIPDYLSKTLGQSYHIETAVINAADYGVAQVRERAIFLLTNRKCKSIWQFPYPGKKKTMAEAIGELPILDPMINDIPYDKHIKIFPLYEERKRQALEISQWHKPPTHVYRQVYAMMHTPSGKSAFDNDNQFKPKKKDGEIVRGYRNTYKRQEWDKPAFTVTMYNRTIGSQNNVHPGRLIGVDEEGNTLYSDPRVLTIFELMRIMSLPDDWNIPAGFSDNFIRSVMGEGIPPLLVKKIMEEIPNEY